MSQPHLGTVPARRSGSISLVLNYEAMSNMPQMYSKGMSNIKTSGSWGSLAKRTLAILTGIWAST